MFPAKLLITFIFIFQVCDSTFKPKYGRKPEKSETETRVNHFLYKRILYEKTLRRKNPLCNKDTKFKKNLCEELTHIDTIAQRIGASYIQDTDTRDDIPCIDLPVGTVKLFPSVKVRGSMIWCFKTGETGTELSNSDIYASTDYDNGFFLWFTNVHFPNPEFLEQVSEVPDNTAPPIKH